jgi:metallo-beta-lactamase family protein
MKITMHGAAGGEVTGSAYHVQTKEASVLVDCGMFQGGKKAEAHNRPPTGAKQKLDAVLLTHAHLDHCGRLPLLARRGHKVRAFATAPTIDLAALILRDSARIQESDAERQNRKRARAGQDPVQPLYSVDDAEAAIQWLEPVPYAKPAQVAPGMKAVWTEAGHMLGSASIKLLVEEDGRTKSVVFSGDLGPRGALILRDYEPFHAADMVFLETTYGDKDHRSFRETAREFATIVRDAVKSRGKILVPTFAVGRAQLLTTLLSGMVRKKITPAFPVFLDSPMAIEATKIYSSHREVFDDDMIRYMSERPLREDLRLMRATPTAAESKEINDQAGPCLIMAGAGMCTAGRILHHFKENLWRPNTHVLIVGYQSPSSLGRRLVEGADLVSIHGEKIAVKAEVHTMGGFSGHAGQTDLMRWYDVVAPSKPRLVLTHGEDRQREAFAALVQKKYRIKPALPGLGDTIEL